MTLARKQLTPHQFGIPRELDAFLSNGPTGLVLVLSTSPNLGLSLQALAGHAVMRACRIKHIESRLFSPSPLVLPGVDVLSGSSRDHNRRWLCAGDICEQIIAMRDGPSITHVIYLDVWSIGLDRGVAHPKCPRLYISNPVWHSENSDNYWASVTEWVNRQPSIITLSAEMLLQCLPDNWWRTATPVNLVADLLPRPSDKKIVLFHEIQTSSPPQIQSLKATLADPAYITILLSPYISEYRLNNGDMLDRCLFALDPADISSEVFGSILSTIDVYVTPSGLPYGPASLANLSPNARSCLQDVSKTIAQHPAPSRHHLQAVGQDVDPRQTLGSWWGKLEHTYHKAILPSVPVPDFSIIVCCYKFLQRFRIFMQSVVRQTHPVPNIEVCVASPGNPDGLHEYIQILRIAHPNLRVNIVDIPPDQSGNKGKMLNAAFKMSTAPVIMVGDCDLVLAPTFVATMLHHHRAHLLLGCWRTPMSKNITAQILSGNLDPVEHFDALCTQWDEAEYKDGVRQGLLGYCQIVSRDAFHATGYPEEYEGYNQSDIVFVERLQRQGITPHFIKEHLLLHLSHHRDWTGTKVFL